MLWLLYPIALAAPDRPTRALMKNISCNNGAPVAPTQLIDLTLYINNGTGTALDHYLSSFNAAELKLEGYQPEKLLGKVLIQSAGCDCPVRLVQMIDNQTNIFGGHIDHKLVRDGDEPDRFGEAYAETDEVVYCAQKKGACGATLPLYKEWNGLNYDSSYSTSDIPTILTERYPTRPLCYIWSADEASTIASPIQTQPSNLIFPTLPPPPSIPQQ